MSFTYFDENLKTGVSLFTFACKKTINKSQKRFSLIETNQQFKKKKRIPQNYPVY